MSEDGAPAGNANATRRFLSAGIDIGSSTMHVTLSELKVGRPDNFLFGKPCVLERRIVYQSPIRFTPFTPRGVIDEAEIAAFVAETYRAAGVTPSDIGAGAVICTGEAAQKSNAAAITAAIAGASGRFVCATAGHHYEAVLAAHGSGAVEASQHLEFPVLSLDIGGGTTKRSYIVGGKILETAAINVGSRLIAFAADGRVTRIEQAGRSISQAAGVEVRIGETLSIAAQRAIAQAAARLVSEFVGLAALSPLARELLVTNAPSPLPDVLVVADRPRLKLKEFAIVMSGGVAEFVFGDTAIEPGDLGPELGAALRSQILDPLPPDHVLVPRQAIRATVIGACQQSFQVSGETVFVGEGVPLPLRNVPVRQVALDWTNVAAQTVAAAVDAALGRDEVDGDTALYFDGPQRVGYGKATAIAAGIVAGLQPHAGVATLVVVFARNIAGIVGAELARRLPGRHIVCLDEIEVGELDYLDIDGAPAGETYLPVVTKSLVFSRNQSNLQVGSGPGGAQKN